MRQKNKKRNKCLSRTPEKDLQEKNFQTDILSEEIKPDEITESDKNEMEQLIRREVVSMKIPEKLKPENMQKVLEASSKAIKIKRRRHFAAAAAIFVVIGGSIILSRNKPLTYNTNHIQTPPQIINNDELTEDILQYAGSYETVEEAVIEAKERLDDVQYGSGIFGSVKRLFIDTDTKKATTESLSGANASYSTTNVQVEGVDEADITKTDGKYIYRLRADYIRGNIPQKLEIISADSGKLKKVGTFTFDEEEDVTEFYLYQDMAVAIIQGYITTSGNTADTNKSQDASQDSTKTADYVSYNESFTKILFINMQDKKNPVKAGELTQSGYYVQSRLTDGYLYIVTGESAFSDSNGENNIWIPCVEHKRVPYSQIFIPEGVQNTEFTTIASVDLQNAGEYADSRSILVSSDDFYMSSENIYLYNIKYSTQKKNEKIYTDATEITKFYYAAGKFSGKASGEIAGRIQDSFAIDEYEGRLRVVTSVTHKKRTTITDNIRNTLTGNEDTDDKLDNAVYVLDENLSVLGSITGIAEDERVYSARFQENIGYFVTYRETDPLFSVDFSDPENPKLIGELKLPGFSEYLHFYSDNLLFGIGQNNNGNIKLSMFDISDPTEVKEIDKCILKDMDYCEALHNYRSVLIDPEKNVIGFSGETWSSDEADEIGHYDLFSWDKDEGFTRILKHIFKATQNQESSGYNSRGIYIQNTLYVVEYYSKHITAYNLKSGKKIGML